MSGLNYVGIISACTAGNDALLNQELSVYDLIGQGKGCPSASYLSPSFST